MKVAKLPIQEQQSGSRIQRTVLLALAIMAVSFALGARSWVAFFLAPDVANGSPVGLFTQTDYPAITIASRIISTGRGDQLYDLAAQQREQTRLAEEGYILLPRDDELRYPYPYTPFIALLLTPFAELSPLAGMAVWNLGIRPQWNRKQR